MTASEANKGPVLRPALFLAAAATAVAAFGAVGEPSRSFMSRQDYVAELRTIEMQTRLALGECRAFSGRHKEICKAEARADERVRKAELEARYQGTVAAASEIETVRLKAHDAVARARCIDLRGEERDSCLRYASLKL